MTDMVQMRLHHRSRFHRLASMRMDSARCCNNTRFGVIWHRLHRSMGFTIVHRNHRDNSLTAPIAIFTHHRGIQM